MVGGENKKVRLSDKQLLCVRPSLQLADSKAAKQQSYIQNTASFTNKALEKLCNPTNSTKFKEIVKKMKNQHCLQQQFHH
jgi:hypothetical protein